MAAATDRPAPDRWEPSGPGSEVLTGGPADRYSDALTGDATGGMIGGVDGGPLAVDPLAVDPLAADDPLGPVPAEGYRDVLSEAFPPAPAAEPASPTAPPAPTGPEGRVGHEERTGRDGRDGRARPARPAGNPRRRSGPEPAQRRRRRAGDAAGSEPATVRSVRTATATVTATPGTVPVRLSQPDADRVGIRWVWRAFVLLVLVAVVVGNLVHGCASRLADQGDRTRPASVSR